MLTADLVRVRRRKGVILPRYLDPRSDDLLGTAAALVATFERAASATPPATRGELDEAIADLVEQRADPLLFRGLVKLLYDRTDLEPAFEGDPVELRARLFEEAARDPLRRAPGRRWSDKRAEIVTRVAGELGLTGEELDARLFSDLPANQRIARFRPLEGPALLDRYNLALAQAVLLRAVGLVVELAPAEVGAYRQVFRELKFRQLIHTVTATPKGGYRIAIDGPLSLFSNASRYGLAMALFLPTLILLDHWSLEAELRWGKKRDLAIFRLDHTKKLRSHRRARGQYVTDEQRWFEERFDQKPGPWKMTRSAEILQTRRGDVVVPDIAFVHEDGRRAFLEIIGFWRAGSLDTRLAQLDDPALAGLILAVSQRLAGEKKASPPEHPRIVWFKQILSAPRVRERLEEVAG